DLTGNGRIDALDVATAVTLAQGTASGLAAYPLLDPTVVGGVALDYAVDAGAGSDLADYTGRLPRPPIPSLFTDFALTPSGPDPTLSLGQPFEDDRVTARQGDKLTFQDDKMKGRQGDKLTPGQDGDSASSDHPVALSPGHLVTPSPSHVVTVPVL